MTTFSQPSRSSLPCGAYLAYPPRPHTVIEEQAKALVLKIKEDRLDASGRLLADRVIERLARDLPAVLATWFKGATLVPVPRKGLPRPNSVWASRTLCERLVAHGLGGDVHEILRRARPIRKSAGNPDRPSADEHAASFDVRVGLERPTRIVLVDDVVTRGATFMGAALRLDTVLGSEIEVTAFALAHTISRGTVDHVIAPAVSTIRHLPDGSTLRV